MPIPFIYLLQEHIKTKDVLLLLLLLTGGQPRAQPFEPSAAAPPPALPPHFEPSAATPLTTATGLCFAHALPAFVAPPRCPLYWQVSAKNRSQMTHIKNRRPGGRMMTLGVE